MMNERGENPLFSALQDMGAELLSMTIGDKTIDLRQKGIRKVFELGDTHIALTYSGETYKLVNNAWVRMNEVANWREEDAKE